MYPLLMEAAAPSLYPALLAHPLAGLGRQAAQSQAAVDQNDEFQQFNLAIAPYRDNRTNAEITLVTKTPEGKEESKRFPCVDWAKTARLGAALAAHRSDLKLYGYLALAAFHSARGTDESPYLALGAVLVALSDLIEHGWERCIPAAPSKRQAQLKWLSEEVTVAVKAGAPKPAEAKALIACADAAERLGAVSGKAFGLDYPLMRELREALSAYRAERQAALDKQAKPAPPAKIATPPPPAPEQKAVPPPDPPKEVAPAVPPAAPATEALAAPLPPRSEPPAPVPLTPVDPNQLSRDAIEDQLSSLVVTLAAQLRAESLTDPASYWMLRALRWANHDLLKPERIAEVVANKYKTQLPLPQGHKTLSKQIPQRLKEGHFAAVVGECEELFGNYPMWLDLQRWVAAALEGLGAKEAREAVRSQAALLLGRNPELGKYRFGDREGTGFADEETVGWLAGQGRAVGGKVRAQGVVPVATVTKEAEPVESTEAAIPEGLLAGVQALQEQIRHAGSGRRKFDLRLRLVELLLQHSRNDVAMPIIDILLAEIKAHELDEWEPALSEKTLHYALQAAQTGDLSPDRKIDLWRQLSSISPAIALRIQEK